MKDAKMGPVFAFTDRRPEVERFYRDVVGLSAKSSDADAAWLETANADLAIHGRGDRQTPPEVRAASGFVLWLGVPHLEQAWRALHGAGATVGELYGDYFFARDPDGRYLGFYPLEEHEHGDGHSH